VGGVEFSSERGFSRDAVRENATGTQIHLKISRISSSSLKQLWVGHVFFRFGTSGLQELVEAKEFTADGAEVGGPLGFAGLEREGGSNGGEFGIKIVKVVEDEGFADHGEFWRTEFVLATKAMMAPGDGNGVKIGTCKTGEIELA
jgi:hypothetical protein